MIDFTNSELRLDLNITNGLIIIMINLEYKKG